MQQTYRKVKKTKKQTTLKIQDSALKSEKGDQMLKYDTRKNVRRGFNSINLTA